MAIFIQVFQIYLFLLMLLSLLALDVFLSTLSFSMGANANATNPICLKCTQSWVTPEMKWLSVIYNMRHHFVSIMWHKLILLNLKKKKTKSNSFCHFHIKIICLCSMSIQFAALNWLLKKNVNSTLKLTLISSWVIEIHSW